MCFLPCASRQGRPFWPPAGDHEGRPYGAFAPIRKDWEARMAYHILLVDDAPELRRMVGELLEGAGYAVTLAADCAQARRAWTESQPDAALLDVMLPDGDGFSLLEELRGRVPVILLTANDLETDIVTGLELGAEDYITKPFSLAVLRARVNAQLRRQAGGAGQVVEVGEFIFDFARMEYRKAGRLIELSKTEQKLLKLLVQNRGVTLTRADLMDRVWTDGAAYVDENALSVTVKRLRDKLEDTPSKPKYLKTVYGVGYTWAVK